MIPLQGEKKYTPYGSSWTTRGKGWVTTQHTWYDVYLKISGSNLEVWRGPKGGALTQILSVSNIASVLTTDLLRFEVAPNTQYSYDDIIVYSDELRSMTTFTHNDANEQTAMTVDGTTTNFAYDAWGRMTSRTRGSLTAQYAWRYGSLLANVTSDFPGEASEVDYVYDGLHNRRLKLADGTDYTWTRYDANGRALADYSNGASYWDIGGRQRSFHGGAEIEGSSPQTGTPSYYLQNHLGSTVATTDASKDIVASYQYTPYGEFLSESTSGDHATFGYTGHRLDRELNHYYAKYRYYNPSTMRWLSRDPLGMVDGPNVYGYVHGNPLMYADLFGLSQLPWFDRAMDWIFDHTPDSFNSFFGGDWGGLGNKIDCVGRCLQDDNLFSGISAPIWPIVPKSFLARFCKVYRLKGDKEHTNPLMALHRCLNIRSKGKFWKYFRNLSKLSPHITIADGLVAWGRIGKCIDDCNRCS